MQTKTRDLGQRIYQQWKVPADVVHHEEKSPDADRPDAGGDDLHQDGEDQGEPCLGEEVVEHQRGEGVGRVQVESEGRQGGGQDGGGPQQPEPGVDPELGHHQVGDVTPGEDPDTAPEDGGEDEPVADLLPLVVVVEVGDVVVGPGVPR